MRLQQQIHLYKKLQASWVLFYESEQRIPLSHLSSSIFWYAEPLYLSVLDFTSFRRALGTSIFWWSATVSHAIKPKWFPMHSEGMRDGSACSASTVRTHSTTRRNHSKKENLTWSLACEVMVHTSDALCRTRLNYTAVIEELKPDVIFVVER